MSIDFDGTDDFAQKTSWTEITNPITLSVWIKLDSSAAVQCVIAIGDDDATSQFRIAITTDPVARAQQGSGNWFADGSTSLDTTNWFHLAAVFPATNSRIIYVNGQNDGSSANTEETLSGSATFSIGRQFWNGADSQYFNGKISEAAVWNTDLSADEVARLYDSRIKGTPLQIQSSNLVGYWPMDDGPAGTSADGDTLADLSGLGNNATGDDGGNDAGLTWFAEEVLSYPANIISVIVAAAGAAFEKILAEGIGISDAIVKATTRNLAESIGISDALTKDTTRNLSEAIGISDGIVKGPTKILGESIGISDAVVKDTTRNLGEAIGIADTISKGGGKVLAESVGISDAVTKATTRNLTESISITDVVNKSITRTLTEAIGVVDSIIKSIVTQFRNFIRNRTQKTFSVKRVESKFNLKKVESGFRVTRIYGGNAMPDLNYIDEVVNYTINITNVAGDLADPDTVKLTAIFEDGTDAGVTKVDAQAMSTGATGVYTYELTYNETENWTVIIKSTSGNLINKESFSEFVHRR